MPRLKGVYSTIWGIWAANYAHWLIECLPRTTLLEIAAKHQPITLLMPQNMLAVYKGSLSCCPPAGVRLQYLADPMWVQLDRFVFLSFFRQERKEVVSHGRLPGLCAESSF